MSFLEEMRENSHLLKVKPQTSNISLLNEAETREGLPTTKPETIYIYLHVLFAPAIVAWEEDAHPSVAAFQSAARIQSRGRGNVQSCDGAEDIKVNLCEDPLSFSGSLNTQTAEMIKPPQIRDSPFDLLKSPRIGGDQRRADGRRLRRQRWNQRASEENIID